MTDYTSLSREQLIERLSALERIAPASHEPGSDAADAMEVTAYLRLLADNIDVAFWVRDLEADRFVYLSPACEKIYGLPIAEVHERSPCTLVTVHPDDRDSVAAASVHCGLGRAVDLEYRIQRGPDDLRWVHVRSFPIRDAAGRITRMAGVVRDVTARRNSEQEFRTIIQASMDSFWKVGPDARILDCNEAACTMLGFSREEMLALCLHDIDLNEDSAAAAEHIRRVKALGHDRFETQHRHKNGDAIDVEVSAYHVPGSEGGLLFAFSRDITRRKQSELALREAKIFKQAILDAVSTQVAVLDQSGAIVEVNAAWHRFAQENPREDGQPRRNAEIGANYLEICRSAVGLDSEGAREVAEGIQAVLDGRIAGFSREYPCHASHARRWFLATVTPLGREGGGVVISHSDISAPRLLAEELRQSEARTRSILRAAPVDIGMLVDRVFQEVNQAMTDMTGYAREELIGRSARMLYLAQEDFDFVGHEKYRQIETAGIGRVETRWRTKNGQIINIALSSAPVVQGDLSQGVAFTAQDITALKQSEQDRLAHEASQRSALVREVHHRIKNNLQGVIGLMRQHISSHPETRAGIEAAIDQVHTISVVHGLQGRLGHHELRLCEMLHEVCSAAASLGMADQPPAIDDRRSSDIWLDNSAAVTVALILNELVHNALKHSLQTGAVKIRLDGDGDMSRVSISNPGAPLPPGFDLASGAGCGTGLDLVRTLMPRQGASLDIHAADGQVAAELRLFPPVTLPPAPGTRTGRAMT